MGQEEGRAIETRAAVVELGTDGIVRVTFRAGTAATLEDAEAVMAAGAKLIEGRPRPFLTNISQVGAVSRPARVYFASEVAQRNCLASAVLVGGPVSRAIGNFFLGLNRPPFPVRLFTDEAEALAWLQQYLTTKD